MIAIEAFQSLATAKSSLIEFNRDTIVDILELETPPDDVEVIAECFFMLKGGRDISWKNIRAAMLDEDYIKNLSDINCDIISLKQLSQCKSHLKVSELILFVVTHTEMYRFVLYCIVLYTIYESKIESIGRICGIFYFYFHILLIFYFY